MARRYTTQGRTDEQLVDDLNKLYAAACMKLWMHSYDEVSNLCTRPTERKVHQSYGLHFDHFSSDGDLDPYAVLTDEEIDLVLLEDEETR